MNDGMAEALEEGCELNLELSSWVYEYKNGGLACAPELE
jgi:hypothetical protein